MKPAIETYYEAECRTRFSRRSSKFLDGSQKRLYERLLQTPPAGIHPDEVRAHFQGMPAHYWDHVTKGELIWGIETIHGFFAKLKQWEAPGAPAVANLRHCPERGFTKIGVCTWDRPGLLAKIAATFSALRINILQADVYTRADNVALDVFQVSDLNQPHITDTTRLEHLIFLLEGALNDPPRFVSLWASQFHRVCDSQTVKPVLLEFDNDSSAAHTIMRVEAADRLGLLYDILEALNDCFVNVAQAVVHTEANFARDVFYITDLEGAKITNELSLATVRKAVLQGIRG